MGEGKQQLGWWPYELAHAGGKPNRRVPAVAGPRGVNVHGVSSKLATVEEVQGMREVELARGSERTVGHATWTRTRNSQGQRMGEARCRERAVCWC